VDPPNCRKEDGHLLTVVMILGALDECVLTIREAETLYRKFLVSFNDTSNNSSTISSSILTD